MQQNERKIKHCNILLLWFVDERASNIFYLTLHGEAVPVSQSSVMEATALFFVLLQSFVCCETAELLAKPAHILQA